MIDIIDAIKDFAKLHFSNAKYSHDWEHTLRVYNLCLHIGQKEGADLDVLSIAAYLHDIGRTHQDQSKGTICHAEKGAEIAREILTVHPIPEERGRTSSTASSRTGSGTDMNHRLWRPKSSSMQTSSMPSEPSGLHGLTCLPAR